MSSPTAVSFDSNSLQTANIFTKVIDSESIATKNMKLFALAHENASKIPFVSYPSKTIKLSGTIYGSSIADLDSRLDTFRSYFVGQEKNLDIAYNGSTRRYIATLNSIVIDRPGGLLAANFAIEFICSIPFGQNTSTTSALSAAGRTAATYSDAYTFLGTAPYQLPVTTITLTAVTGGTAAYITFGNGGNGQTITVLRTWTAGDVLVIDCVNKTVTVNGNPVNFTGGFPEFPPGAQTLQYGDSFTTRTFTISSVYAVGYL